jgi:hypothetical protein
MISLKQQKKSILLKALLLLLTSGFIPGSTQAQDTLPIISVKKISDKVIVSWVNNYGANISTINIQRSKDSLKNYTTIGSVLDPMNKENGFVDGRVPAGRVFYRVFVAFEGGRYLFTKAYKPVIDTSVAEPTLPQHLKIDEFTKEPHQQPGLPQPPGVIAKPDVPLIPPYIPSKFIFINKENNVTIELPDATENSRYSIQFFDEDDKKLFELKKITEPYLVVEKVNFIHAGWFYFKLYQDGILREKNQFYIPKEGKTGIPASEIDKRF